MQQTDKQTPPFLKQESKGERERGREKSTEHQSSKEKNIIIIINAYQ